MRHTSPFCWAFATVVVLLLTACAVGPSATARQPAPTVPPTPAPRPSATPSPTPVVTPIADTVVGKPVGAGEYVFWIDIRNNQVAIYRYNLSTQQTALIQQLTQPSDASAMASDGQTLAWVNTTSPLHRIQLYNLTTRQVSTITMDTESRRASREIALDNGILYYEDTRGAQEGIYARNVTTGQEQRVIPHGYVPVADDGTVVWSDSQLLSSNGEFSVIERRLYAQRLDGSLAKTLIVTGTDWFTDYAISGDRIVWSFNPRAKDRRVTSYHLGTGQTQVLSSNDGYGPTIRQDRVAWRETKRLSRSKVGSVLQVYDYTTNQTFPLVATSTVVLQFFTLVNPETIAFTLEYPRSTGAHLYVVPIQQASLEFHADD